MAGPRCAGVVATHLSRAQQHAGARRAVLGRARRASGWSPRRDRRADHRAWRPSTPTSHSKTRESGSPGLSPRGRAGSAGQGHRRRPRAARPPLRPGRPRRQGLLHRRRGQRSASRRGRRPEDGRRAPRQHRRSRDTTCGCSGEGRMKFGIVVFPGSNCDQDCHHVAKDLLGCEADYVWHHDTDLKGADVVSCRAASPTATTCARARSPASRRSWRASRSSPRRAARCSASATASRCCSRRGSCPARCSSTAASVTSAATSTCASRTTRRRSRRSIRRGAS